MRDTSLLTYFVLRIVLNFVPNFLPNFVPNFVPNFASNFVPNFVLYLIWLAYHILRCYGLYVLTVGNVVVQRIAQPVQMLENCLSPFFLAFPSRYLYAQPLFFSRCHSLILLRINDLDKNRHSLLEYT